MEVLEIFDEKIVRIGDILEQISSLNKRIAFHKMNNGDNSTINQYEYLRKRFVDELQELLRGYKLDANISVSAD